MKKLPKMSGLLLMMGPAFVWAAIAQGSGELIWWPYFAAKYGAAFIGLLLPASLIQFFINREVSRYTAITGKGIWSVSSNFMYLIGVAYEKVQYIDATKQNPNPIVSIPTKILS